MKKLLLFALFVWLYACGTEPTPTYTITTSASPTEGGSVAYAPSGSPQDEGTSLTFTATPSEGYLFSQWQGDLSGTSNPSSLTLSKNVSVTGVFEKRTYPLTITIEGEGTVKEEVIQAKTDYEHGTRVRLTPQAAEGWAFKGWTGDIQSTEAVQEVTVTDAVNLTATFEKRSYPLTIMIEGEGTVKEEVIQAKTDYEHGTQVRLTAVPATEWWVFEKWTGDVESTQNPTQFTIDQVIEVKAVFNERSYIMDVDTIEVSALNIVFEPVQYTAPKYWALTGNRSLYYVSDGVEYAISGNVRWGDPLNRQVGLSQLKRESDTWEFVQYFEGIDIYWFRNHEFIENESTFLVCDHGAEWRNIPFAYGHLFLGKYSGPNVDWTQVSTSRSFYHDCSAGDLNGDGILDVVGAHMGTYGENRANNHIYIGKSDGTFEEQLNIQNIQNIPDLSAGHDVEVYDIDNDGIMEIVNFNPKSPDGNQYAFNYFEYDAISKEIKLEMNQILDLPNQVSIDTYVNQLTTDHGMGNGRVDKPARKRFFDFNLDGKTDFVIDYGSKFVQLNNGDGTYETIKIYNRLDNGFTSVDYDVFDLENDGDPDIIITGDDINSDFDFNLSWLIFVNDDGVLKQFRSEDYIIKGDPYTSPNNFNGIAGFFRPFIKNGYLHFRGIGPTHTNILDPQDGATLLGIYHSTIKTDIPASYIYQE